MNVQEPDERMEALFRERGFGLVYGFGARPALLVIDLIRGFTDETMPLGSDLAAEIDATNALIGAAHGRDVPVLFTVECFDQPDLADAGLWKRKQRGVHTLRRGTPAVELDPRLIRAPSDHVITKKFASAFFGTDLVSRLTVARIDTLLIAGATTSGCVRASAIDAMQYGFVPVIVREAVGDRAEAAHRQSLFDLEQKYADVVSLAEAVGYLGGLPAS